MTPSPEPPQQPRHAAVVALAALWRVVRRGLVFALNILLALILLFEEWGWRPLARAIAWFAKFRLVARLEAWIASLPPYPALAIFALPGALLFPVKLLGLWLLASGHVIWAGALLVGAKIVSTAFVARLFMLTQPKLMQIGWFRRGYEWFMPWKEALFAYVRASFAWRYGRMVKTRIKQIAKRAWADVKPRMKAAWLEVRTRGRLMWRRLTGAA